MSSGTTGSPDLLLSSSLITVASHNKIILIIIHSFNPVINKQHRYKPFLNDTSGNRIALAGLSNFQAAPVTTFSPDVTKPTLVSWTYDVFQGIIELTFSEIVQVSQSHRLGGHFSIFVVSCVIWSYSI